MKQLLSLLLVSICLTGIITLSIRLFKSSNAEPTVFTNLQISNASPQDSVKVYVTLQSPNSVIGLFGIQEQDTIGSCSKGFFYAIKGNTYQSNDTLPLLGVVISFGGDNWPCSVAIEKGFPNGVNVFECSINTPYESFDIGCEDGVNSIINVSVSDTANWTTGYSLFIENFRSAENVLQVGKNVGIRGVFPYRCTDCKDEVAPIPENCLNLPESCSPERTCQAARTNHIGGTIFINYKGN